MAIRINPDSKYGMATDRDYIVPKTTTKVKLEKLLSLRKKIIPKAQVEVETKKELPKEL